MMQPKQIAPEPSQNSVKEHVKEMLRKLPRRPQTSRQAHSDHACNLTKKAGLLR
jgi:hypothetical protein